MCASVYLDQERDQFQRVLRNMDVEEIQQILCTTQNCSIKTCSPCTDSWTGIRAHRSLVVCCTTTSTKNLAQRRTSSADSVLCLGGKCGQYPESAKVREQSRELDNFDSEPFVFEEKISPGHTTTLLLQEAQKLIEGELKIHPQNFEERLIFMSMYNDIGWTMRDNRSHCVENSSRVFGYARKFFIRNWTFLCAGDENKWYGALSYKPDGEWESQSRNDDAEVCREWSLVLRGTSALYRGSLKCKGGGEASTHSNAEPQTAALLLRTKISVYQLSIYGAVAHWCNNQILPAAEPHDEQNAAPEVPPELVSLDTKHKTLDISAWEDLAQKRDEEFGDLFLGVELARVCEDAGLTRTVSAGQFIMTRPAVEPRGLGVVSVANTPILVTVLQDTQKKRLETTPQLVLLKVLLLLGSTNRDGVEIEIYSMMNDGTRS